MAKEKDPNRGVIFVLAKTPLPGHVKSRLWKVLSPEQASDLTRACLVDTLNLVRSVPQADSVLALDAQLNLPLRAGRTQIQVQPDGDLGERLAGMFDRLLLSYDWAIVLGGDSPHLSSSRLEEAVIGLEGGREAVLGPAEDGGFYLLGLRRSPKGLFENVPWSSSKTGRAMLMALEKYQLTTEVLAEEFDLDRPADLKRLRKLLRQSPDRAPRTAKFLARFDS